MATNLTEYVNPQNFSTVWIYHTPDSDLDGDQNPEVPSNLQTLSFVKGTWTLVIDGVVKVQNVAFNGAPEFSQLDGSKFVLGDLIEDEIYTKVTTTAVTVDKDIPAQIFDAQIVGSGRNPTTAWVEGNADGSFSAAGDIWSTLTDGETWGIIYDNTILTSNNTALTYDGYYDGAVDKPYFEAADGTLYIRWQSSYSQGGATAYKVKKIIPARVETVIENQTTNEESRYKFYNVEGIIPSEVNNFRARAVVVLPHHISQRTVAKRQGNYSGPALILDTSHMRVVLNMSQALLEIEDLKENYGIEARAHPVELQIGAEFVQISSNQVVDLNTFGADQNHILQYDSITERYETKIPNTSTIVEGTNLYYTDGRVQNVVRSQLTTDDVKEGDNNLYLNGAGTTDDLTEGTVKLYLNGAGTTDDLTEGSTNLYYTAARADSRITAILQDDDTFAAASATNIASSESIKAYVDTAISNLVDSAPDALNTLNELAAAINDDAAVYDTIIERITTLETDLSTTIDNLTITTYGDTAPTDPQPGELWFDTATAGELLMWDGFSWIQLTGVVGSPASGGGGGSTDLSGYVTTTALNTAIQDMVEFSDLSVVTATASGGGALAYSATTGQFTFTPAVGPDLTGYATETYVDDAILEITGATEIPDDINDLTDVDGIIPTSLTDLGITDGTNGQVLSTDGSGTFSFIDTATSLTDLGITDGTNGQVLSTDGSGTFSFIDTSSSVVFGAWSSTETVSATGSNNGTSNSSATIPSGTKGILIKGSTSSQNNSQGQGRLFVNGTQRAAGSVQNDGDGSVIDFDYLIYIDATTGSGTYFLNSRNVTVPGTAWVGSGAVTSIQVQAQSTSSDKNTTHSTNIYYS